MSKAYSHEECQKMFLDHVRNMVSYWLDEKRTPETKEKLNGLAFSILVLLDGGTSLPGFKVVPTPHPDDKQFQIDEGDDYWPDDVDIAGGLHEMFYEKPR